MSILIRHPLSHPDPYRTRNAAHVGRVRVHDLLQPNLLEIDRARRGAIRLEDARAAVGGRTALCAEVRWAVGSSQQQGSGEKKDGLIIVTSE